MLMMSVERPFEVWEEVQRQGQDLADRLAHGFNGLIQSHVNPPSFPWPNPPPASKFFDIEFPSRNKDFGFGTDSLGVNGVTAILDIGNRIGQAGADFGASLNGMVQQFFRRLPVPLLKNESGGGAVGGVWGDMVLSKGIADVGLAVKEDLSNFHERLKEFGFKEDDVDLDEEATGFDLSLAGLFGKSQGTVQLSTTFDSRRNDVESSLLARGDLWRVEASSASSASGNNNSSTFLVQLGPFLFLRDSTLLLPVHLSKQHLLWYGYDRKNGMHSLCPAVWSKHRRCLLMSMLCLNPLACNFVDFQFPNGQLTYISGEGLTTSAFLPIGGALLQVQGQFPGEMQFSLSCKNNSGTRITPAVQWPDKSFSLGVEQAVAWQKSGLLVRPTLQLSVIPTFWGSNPGLQAEIIHSMNEHLNVICGYASGVYPSAYALLSVGRSKWNGNVGNSGVVVKAEVPLSGARRPFVTVQLNSGIEF